MRIAGLRTAGVVALAALSGFMVDAIAAGQAGDFCLDCLEIRVGPPTVVRGPSYDELDAVFSALKLADGSFRGFSANGATYAIEGASLAQLSGPRRAVMDAGPPGSLNECGRWLTSVARAGDRVLGMVHQESICKYGPGGQTHKSMAIATSSDDGLTWTDLGTVITGTQTPQPGSITGEGDCTMIDGLDGYLYAYCLRNTDWQTIVARAPLCDPTNWHKYYEGGWTEPGLGGRSTDIGFVGTGAGYLKQPGLVAAVATDPWFGGLRLSLSEDKVRFADLDEPLLTIDGSDWNRPADTDLIAYPTIVNPEDGSNAVDPTFVLTYSYVPPGAGFDSRYLVQHEVAMSVRETPPPVQVGMALTRWRHPQQGIYVTSSGPLTGDRLAYERDTVVAHMLTRAPDGMESTRLEECSSQRTGHLDHLLSRDGSCESGGYSRERTAGWLYASEQPGTVAVYRCYAADTQTHFASAAADCEGLGTNDALLGYGLAP